MKLSLIILAVVTMACAAIAPSRAQRRSSSYSPPTIEELPRRPIDTIKTADPETKVIIFSNNTWEFYRPIIPERVKNSPVYKTNWDTASVFSYRNIELHDIPEVVELKLVEELGDYTTPIIGKVYSKYGPRRRRNHNGVDIPLKIGEPIFSAFEGRIRYSKYNTGGFGNLVIVRHPNGLETWYAHLSKLNCQVGDYVKSGQVIGYGGSTGRSRGPHLHFEMRYQDQTFDPEFLVDFEHGQLRYQTFALEKKFFNIHSRASEILEEDEYEEDLGAVLTAADDSTATRVIEKKPVQPAPSSSTAVYHTIVSGDMLGKLAAKYGTTVDNICRLNKGLTRTTTLKLKQKIRVK